MEQKLICQSCTMPIDDPVNKGTEKDGSASNEYCKYCYQHGVFTEPDMTSYKMRSFIISRMQEMKIPKDIIQRSLDSLPDLKRWRKTIA